MVRFRLFLDHFYSGSNLLKFNYVQLASVERDSDSDSDHDSGNDEPQDFLLRAGAVGNNAPNAGILENSRRPDESPSDLVPIYKVFMNQDAKNQQNGATPHHHLHPVRMESLSQQLAQLTLPR